MKNTLFLTASLVVSTIFIQNSHAASADFFLNPTVNWGVILRADIPPFNEPVAISQDSFAGDYSNTLNAAYSDTTVDGSGSSSAIGTTTFTGTAGPTHFGAGSVLEEDFVLTADQNITDALGLIGANFTAVNDTGFVLDLTQGTIDLFDNTSNQDVFSSTSSTPIHDAGTLIAGDSYSLRGIIDATRGSTIDSDLTVSFSDPETAAVPLPTSFWSGMFLLICLPLLHLPRRSIKKG